MSMHKMHLTLIFRLICSLSSYFLTLAASESVIYPISPHTNTTNFFKKVENLTVWSGNPFQGSIKLESLQRSQVIISGNTTITSENKTFKVGFFAPDDEFMWYFGIWYASIPIPTYVWVANREKPIKNLFSAIAEITDDGKLAVVDQDSRTVVWATNNVEKASDFRLLEQGNLVLLSNDGRILWQSFDFPTDTWLPGMNLTAEQRLTSWKSSVDPTPGRYSLRLNPPDYGEIALFYSSGNGSFDMINLYTYWTTGNWSGNAFAGVPQMTIPYIYRFEFIDPFTPLATFGYTEVPIESGVQPPLTRFILDHLGQLKQYTWSQQSEVWNTFWSQPDNLCRVYALCGNLGVCNGNQLSPCQCLNGFRPVNSVSWSKYDFSEGCWRGGGEACDENDKFEEVGAVSYERTAVVSFSGIRSECESACLRNCSCVGLYHNPNNNVCKNLYGSLLNLHNVMSDSTIQDKLYVRVETIGAGRKQNKKTTLLIGMICGILVILSIGTINLYLRRRKIIRRQGEEEGVFQVMNLKVFSYKELHAATRGFSVKLGHGGFGAVFQGVLSDSSAVAVKRLERPGGGEKEFRAEVGTIGNIQHVNLVRLRGFCCENSHRLLVYDFMPNGPLSTYLRQGSQNLSWDVRFRVAVGTARGIAYLHEECRNCIIHCDIKPENILLDEDFSAKVSDFGLAKLIGRDFSRVLATMRGTWGYVAPEWISGVGITTKADVYSYGMTLLELIGGRRNVEGPPSASGGEENEKGKWFFPPWAAHQIIEGNVAAVIDERLGSMYNEAEAARLGLVAVWCIQDDESMRPPMGMVVKMLEGVVEVAVPPPPKLLQALVSGESFRGVEAESHRSVPQDDAGSFDVNVSISADSRSSLVNSGWLKRKRFKGSRSLSIMSLTLQRRVERRPKQKSCFISHWSEEATRFKKLVRRAVSEIVIKATDARRWIKHSKIERVTENVGGGALESNGSPSSTSPSLPPPSTEHMLVLEMEKPPSDSVSSSDDQALLHEAPSEFLPHGEGGDYPPLQTFEDFKTLLYIESVKLWAIAAPIAFNILCNYGINSFTSIFVGHIGDLELSGVAISLSVIANLSFGFLLGMASALETLCGQAYGAGEIKMLGVYMQRSWIILTAACFSLLPLYIYSKPLLKLLGQRHDMAEIAGRFSMYIIPQMFSLAINFPTQKFLQAQSKVAILAWVGFVALFVHVGVLVLFIKVFNWGLAGAAAAYDVSAWGIALAQVVYITGWCQDSWSGLSWLAFRELWAFLKLSVASAIMLCLEIWYFMSIIVLTGHLEDPVLAVGSLSICMNLNGWEGMLFIGVNAAIAVRVSNELGSGHPRGAKYSVFVTVVESLLIGLVSMVLIIATKDDFAVLFTNSDPMQKAVADLAYLLGVTMVLNSIQPVISGVAIGGGWQGLVAYINLTCYYIIGLPIGFVLGYKTKLGVQGIWMGMIFGTFLQTVILLIIVWKTNWNEEVAQASERMRRWGGQDTE